MAFVKHCWAAFSSEKDAIFPKMAYCLRDWTEKKHNSWPNEFKARGSNQEGRRFQADTSQQGQHQLHLVCISHTPPISQLFPSAATQHSKVPLQKKEKYSKIPDSMRPHPLNPPHHNHDQSSSWEDNNYAYPRSHKPVGPAADLSMPDWPVRVPCPPRVRRGVPRRRPGWLGWGWAVGNLRLERVVANLGLMMTWWNNGHGLISPGRAKPCSGRLLSGGKAGRFTFCFFFSLNQQQHVRSICTSACLNEQSFFSPFSRVNRNLFLFVWFIWFIPWSPG